jgi:hypothetical protein
MVQNIPDTTVPKREAEKLKQILEKCLGKNIKVE